MISHVWLLRKDLDDFQVNLGFIILLESELFSRVMPGEGPLSGKSASEPGDDSTSDSDTNTDDSSEVCITTDEECKRYKPWSNAYIPFSWTKQNLGIRKPDDARQISFSGIRERLTEDGIVVKRSGIPYYVAIHFIFDNLFFSNFHLIDHTQSCAALHSFKYALICSFSRLPTPLRLYTWPTQMTSLVQTTS